MVNNNIARLVLVFLILGIPLVGAEISVERNVQAEVALGNEFTETITITGTSSQELQLDEMVHSKVEFVSPLEHLVVEYKDQYSQERVETIKRTVSPSFK